MSNSLYGKLVIGGTLIICFLLGSMTFIIDPIFHFRAPHKNLSYEFQSERYMNDGITRHFNYDAIIIGTSLTESIKTSSVDKIFETQSIKIPYSGAGYKELHESLCRALDYNPSVRVVFRCLDSRGLTKEANYERYSNNPTYLYDENPFNDINYVFNKDILLNYTIHTLQYTAAGHKTTSFDDYANWDASSEYGTEALKKNAFPKSEAADSIPFTEEDYKKVSENIEQNIISAIRDNPNVTFYLYFSPYHISYWEDMVYGGTFNYYIEAEKIAVAELLKYDNVKVFSFLDNREFICNDDYYKDPLHYSSVANTKLFKYMAQNMYQVTAENFVEHYRNIDELYNKESLIKVVSD